MQDLFRKSDQKLHMHDFSNLISRTLLIIRHDSQCFFWTKMSNSILNFISQEERNIKHFQFWTVEIVHCHIDGSAAQWHGPWTQHVNRSSHAMIFFNERTKPCYCKVESEAHSWNQNIGDQVEWLFSCHFCCSVKRVWTLGICGKSWNGIFSSWKMKNQSSKNVQWDDLLMFVTLIA